MKYKLNLDIKPLFTSTQQIWCCRAAQPIGNQLCCWTAELSELNCANFCDIS